MQKGVVIFGTGVLGELVHYYLTKDSSYEVIAFTADRAFIQNKEHQGLPVLPFETIEDYYPPSKFDMFIAVGYNRVNRLRGMKYNEAKAKGYHLITYINSRTTLWPDANIGENCFILEDQTIQPFVKIGNGVIIFPGCIIGHQSSIGDHCFFGAHAVIAGNVTIESYSFIGLNATITDGVTVASGSVIGAGALIVKDTQKNAIYRGRASELHSNDSSRTFRWL